MRNIPSALQIQFQACLPNRAVPQSAHASYMKWLRFYLSFCGKHHFAHTERASLVHFLHKLQEKKRTIAQQRQAPSAVTLHYELLHSGGFTSDEVRSLREAVSPAQASIESSRPPGS